ncbi:MAG: GTP 3',8-cyclase MoaA [Planctomycetota bacterium]
MLLQLLEPPRFRRVVDRQRRRIEYLRLSLTKACSMRCVYCRPRFLNHPRDEPILTPDEIDRLVRHLVEGVGVRKVRLTGGDPTCRADLIEIVERLARIDGVADLAMTTNALTLAELARPLQRAGLGRVNVSLDTLDPQRFAAMTGVDGLDRVLAGIEAAGRVGLGPVKLNSVVVRGENDGELGSLVRHAQRHGLEVRFIELMPMGPLAATWAERYVTVAQMRDGMSDTVRAWEPVEPRDRSSRHDAARRYLARLRDGGVARVGFISPMSDHFCEECNRLRITANGDVFPCLMDEPRGNVLSALRDGRDAAITDELDRAYDAKAEVHPPVAPGVMTHIGG